MTIGTQQDQKVFSDYLNLKTPRNVGDSGTPLEDTWAKLDLVKNIDIALADMDLELSLTNDRFSAGVTTPGNWVVNLGTTNLSIASIAKDSDTACTITFDPQEVWPQLDVSLESLHGLAQLAITKDSSDGLAQLAITQSSASSIPQLAIVKDTASHLCQLAISGVALGAVDPVVTIDLTQDTFLSEATAETMTNWTIDMDTANTGLTAGVITWVSNVQCTLATTGTATAGTFTLMIEALAMTRGLNSGVGSYLIAAVPVSSCTDADVNPVYAVTLSSDVFLGQERTEEMANWVFTMGTSNLVVQSVSWTDNTHCKLITTGIAANTFDVSVNVDALSGSYASGTATYTVSSNTSVCTDAAYGLNPVYAVALTADTFASEAACNLVTNWTFDMTGSGLTITSVIWLSNVSCTIQTSGIALAASFTSMVEALALTRAYNSGVATYDIVTDASTCTDSLFGVDPVYAVVLSDDAFASQVACELVTNWTFDMTGSGLSISSISWTDANNCKINTLGVASEVALASFTAFVENAALVRTRDSGVATYVIADDASTCTDVAHTLDPVYAVVLSEDTFVGEAACELITNWTFDMGVSGLTVEYVDYVDPTNCKFVMSGTPAARFFALCEAAALTGGVDSGEVLYTIATDTSVCTDAPQLVDGIITLRATSAALDAGIFDESVFTLNTATGEHSASGQVSGPYYATESFFVRDGYIMDSFTPPVIPSGLQVFPEFVAADVNADFGTTYTTQVDHFGSTDPINEALIFCTGPTITNPISAITYESIAVNTGLVVQRGFGFRQFYPTTLFDSSVITGFGADLAGVVAGSYINITFAEPEMVQKVDFNMLAAGCTATIDLFGSNDGGTWTAIETEMTLSSIGSNAHEFDNNMSYSRYRFTIHTAANASGGKILELGLYNKPMSTRTTTDLPTLGYALTADGSIIVSNAVDMAAWAIAHPAQDLFITSEPAAAWNWQEMDQVSFYTKSNVLGLVGEISFDISPATTVSHNIVCTEAGMWERHRIPITVPAGESVTAIYFTPNTTKGQVVVIGGPAILNEVFGVTTGSLPQSSSVENLNMTSPRAFMFYVPDLDSVDFQGFTCEANYWDGSAFDATKKQVGAFAGSTMIGYLGASGARKPVYAVAFDFADQFSTDDVHGGYTFDFLVDRYIVGVAGNDIQIVGLSVIDKEVV